MSKKSYRLLESALLLLTVLILMASFYFQYVGGLRPCPLCIMQRFAAFLLMMFCLMGMSLSTLKRGKHVTALQMLSAALGFFFAARQLWLQSLNSEQIPTCMPDLDVLIRYFPWHDVLHALFWGAGDCAEVSWQWLGLSMPGWSLLYFLLMFIVSGFILFSLKKRLNRDENH